MGGDDGCGPDARGQALPPAGPKQIMPVIFGFMHIFRFTQGSH